MGDRGTGLSAMSLRRRCFVTPISVSDVGISDFEFSRFPDEDNSRLDSIIHGAHDILSEFSIFDKFSNDIRARAGFHLSLIDDRCYVRRILTTD